MITLKNIINKLHYRNALSITLLLLISALFTACNNPKSLKPLSYKKWVEDPKNGMLVSKTIEDNEYILQYKPLDYVILQSLKNEITYKEKYFKEYDQTKGLDYFTFRVKNLKGEKSTPEKSIMFNNNQLSSIEYMSFAMQKDFVLVEGNDTLKCMLYHFEPTYNIKPVHTFLLGFEKKVNTAETEVVENKTVIFDNKIFDAGKVQLKIPATKINRIPELKRK